MSQEKKLFDCIMIMLKFYLNLGTKQNMEQDLKY